MREFGGINFLLGTLHTQINVFPISTQCSKYKKKEIRLKKINK